MDALTIVFMLAIIQPNEMPVIHQHPVANMGECLDTIEQIVAHLGPTLRYATLQASCLVHAPPPVEAKSKE